MIPFLLYIVFHPQSKKARALAASIHRMMNEDTVIPGLQIPTRFVPEDGTLLPPADEKPLSFATKVFIMVLADDYLAAGHKKPIPPGRKDWGKWIADLYESCNNKESRCVPFQLSESGWPLDNRLRGVNFPRAYGVLIKRDSWIEQRLLIELVRFIQGIDAADNAAPKLPIKVFLSHTKLDLNKKPEVVNKLKDYLSQDKPVKAWIDSGDIPGGSPFADEIEKGVKDSALLCVLTDSYSGREWCQKEMLLAKQFQRPVLIVNALQTKEIRSFPYCGNVPVIRWAGDSQSAINLLFKEILRHFHAELVLQQDKKKKDILLCCAPELAVVVGKKGKTYLYPDPPLGKVEYDLIKKSGVEVETPLQRFAQVRPLEKINIAVSLSGSGNEEMYGFTGMHLDKAALEISRYLLLAGATLYYGGNLGKEGYTLKLFDIVRAYPKQGIKPVKRIVNYLGWPIPLSVTQRAKYKGLAKIKQIPRPRDISEKDAPEFVKEIENFFPAGTSGLHRFAWARGMTVMREAQTKKVDARVVLGGKIGPTLTAHFQKGKKTDWYSSRIPGVLEEILISMKAKQPVYIVGGFGGCARMVAEILRREKSSNSPPEQMSWEFHKNAPKAPEMRTLYETRKGMKWWSYEDMTTYLQKAGISGLHNNLSTKENKELFETFNIDRIVKLILKGLQQ